MKRKMTLVFHDEELYTQLRIAAVRRRTTASNIVADAVSEWLENREDEELVPIIEAAVKEYEEKGGRDWSEVEREWEAQIAKSEKLSMVAGKKDVQA